MSTPKKPVDDLSKLRGELGALDEQVLRLIARRQQLAMEIGRIKTEMGRSTRDFAQEKEVIVRARRAAESAGLDPDMAEELTSMLIRASLTAQEHDRVQTRGEGGGRKVLVIGGAGKMGRWLARFLSSQGFDVEVADPAATSEEFSHIADWRESDLAHDIIVVAAPLRESNEILKQLARKKPRGVVFDVGSLKTPLREGLKALRDAGAAVTSIHPMFGPDTQLLSGRHVIFVDVGSPEATRAARELFAQTMVIQVEMDLDSHDRVIAYILGLSHAVNIAFADALSTSGVDAEELMRLSSTTFDAQVSVASRVVQENPHLYFEIQSLNEHGRSALEGLLRSAARLEAAVTAGDEASFAELMKRGESYLSGAPENKVAD